MKLLFTTLLSATAFSATLGAAIPVTFIPGNKIYKHAGDLGASIEGASVDARGSLYALNSTHLLNLYSGETVYSHSEDATEQHLAGSRWTRSNVLLIADAVGKRVFKVAKNAVSVAFDNEKFLQPNDLAMTTDESAIYFAGMNYSANTGELWYTKDGSKLKSIDTVAAGLFRTNGIEVSDDDQKLFITSAENGDDGKIASAKVWGFDLVDGVPSNPKVAFDIYGNLPQFAEKGQLDPDGMRADTAGNIYNTLNAEGSILRWNVKNPKDFEVYELPSVAWPTNLEFGGSDGKTLAVVGRCRNEAGEIDGEVTKSCVDVARVKAPGKAWSALQKRY